MKGSHYVLIKSKFGKYHIRLNRNFTVLTGDSGIGKSSVYRHVEQYKRNGGPKSGITIKSGCNFKIISGDFDDFIAINKTVNNSIIILDEYSYFMSTKEFAQEISNTSNYYLMITRDKLSNIPYSAKSVLTLKTEWSDDGFFTYTEELLVGSPIIHSINEVITEDSKSGRSMYKKICSVSVRDIVNEPEGKTTLYVKAYDLVNSGKSCVLIADGAAFGSELLEVLSLLKNTNKVTLWIPESFEYLLLKSGVVWKHGVDNILLNPSEYIDSSEFVSWERFFTWMVTEIMKDTNHPYSKSKLGEWYLSEENLEKFKSVVPKQLLDKICY